MTSPCATPTAAIKAEAFDWQDRVELGNGLAVTLVPTRHWSARGLFDRNKALWASFVLETPAGKLYIVCDSGYGEGKHFRRVAEKHGPLRLAILPIGAYEPRWFMKDQHMNPSDAVKALADCGAQQALAHHHGTFQLTDEAIDAPVIALGEALDEAKIAARAVCGAEAGAGGGDLISSFDAFSSRERYPLRSKTLSQAGAPKTFEVMLAVGIVLDRHVIGDPGQRNIGLGAAKLLQGAAARLAGPAIPVAAVSTRCAPA